MGSAAIGVGGQAAAALLGAVVRGLGPLVLANLRALLTEPFQLGPQVVAAWSVTRDAGAGLLLAALLYGVLRVQFAAAVGLEAEAPWGLLPRLGLAALGVATSLGLARGLLRANNALCAALLHGLPSGGAGLLGAVGAGAALSAVPVLGDVGPAAVALLLLLGEAALACFYVVRAAEIVLLTLLLPLAAALWVVPAAAGVWRAVVGELLVAIFVQAVQVVVLLVFAAGLGPPVAGGASWLWSLGALFLVFRCRGLLARAVRAAGVLAPTPALLLAGGRRAGSLVLQGAGRLTGMVSGPGPAVED